MFKKKKAAAIVMTAMLGMSGIGGGMIRNNVGAMPIVNDEYFLPDDYEVSEEEQHYLDQLISGEISNINIDAQIYDLEDSEEDFAGGCTLLMLAAYNGWLQLAGELLDRGADITLVNNGNRNAVMLAAAAEEKSIEMLHLLHYLRADDVEAHINDINNAPDTALTEALAVGADLDIIELLVSWGAIVDSDLGDEDHPCNPIGAALHQGGLCSADVIEFLLEKGADPEGDYYDNERKLPLKEFFYGFMTMGSDELEEEKYKIMELLLEKGVNTTENDYSDLLEVAMREGEFRIADLLRRFGVNEPNYDDFLERGIHELANDIANLFREYGVSVEDSADSEPYSEPYSEPDAQ